MAVQLDSLAILLVAPSRVLGAVLLRELGSMGASQITCCHTVAEALGYLHKQPVDLVVSSMYFEDGNGIDLITRMRQEDSLQHILFMLISSEERYEMLEPVRQAGVMAILPRPFSRDALQRALSTCLDMVDGTALQLDTERVAAIRVLLVDDSRMARHHMLNVLGKVGVDAERVVQAEDGMQAISLLEQGGPFDLVVTDYRMPHVDGEALLQYIRQHGIYSTVPVIMVTSEQNETRLGSIKSNGVTAMMDKPFDAPYLRQLLERHL